MQCSLRLLLCIAFLVSAAFGQTTFSHRTYAHSGLLVGDFNHDGKPDLLGTGNGTFRVLLNNGDGTFRGPVSSTQPGERKALAVGDFNRDGWTDLVGCQIQNPAASPPVTEFAIWTGTGAGTFSQPRKFSLPGFCSSVALEDFDKDGNQDAAVVWTSQNPDFTPNNGITVFFGDGTGNVSHSVTTDHISVIGQGDVPCGFSELVAGNYDRAGTPDVMISTFCNNETFDQSTLVFGAGTGTGHFGFTQTDEANASLRLKKDDLNQDKRLDLFVAESMSGPHAAASTAIVGFVDSSTSGVPAWQKRAIYSFGGDGDCIGSVNGGTAADLNGDGIKDVAFVERFRAGDCIDFTDTYNLGVMLGRADGTYSAPQKFSLPAYPSGIVSADFDRDGRLDLAIATGDSTEVFLNRTNIATCAASPTLRTVTICAPATVSGNTLRLRANSTTGSPITGMKVYVDNSEAFFTPNDTINKNLTLPSGPHRITVRAWDGQGSFSSVMTVTAGATSSCAAPAADRTINLCSPTNESTASNPVKVTAAVATSNKYYSAKVYIDGVAKFSTTSKQVNASLTLSAGRHRISVQAYDTQGAFTKTVFVNVP